MSPEAKRQLLQQLRLQFPEMFDRTQLAEDNGQQQGPPGATNFALPEGIDTDEAYRFAANGNGGYAAQR